MDIGVDQKVSSIEERFATPKIVKNARTGQTYSVGIGLPKETYTKEVNLFSPPSQPHFFQADHFQLVKESEGTTRDETLVDRNKVNILYMHGVFRDGYWQPEDSGLQEKGITIEDIVRDHEASGNLVDVLFVCSNENNSRITVLPFQGAYEKPKIHMQNKPAQGSVMVNSKTGEVEVQMRVKSQNDVEFTKWKNWGRVKVS